MENHQSVTRQLSIPAVRRTIFKDIILILRVWIIEEIGIATLGKSLHILHLNSLIGKCDRL